MAERDDGFLSRWARRKQQAQEEREAAEARAREAAEDDLEAAKEGGADGLPESGPERPEAGLPGPGEPAGEEPLPDFESLTLESDYRPFLRPGVPDEVRNRALQKLWRLDPVFANLDRLNDYDEDYSQIGKSPMAGLRSLYRVGRGMITSEQESAEAAEAAEAAARAAGTDGVGADGAGSEGARSEGAGSEGVGSEGAGTDASVPHEAVAQDSEPVPTEAASEAASEPAPAEEPPAPGELEVARLASPLAGAALPTLVEAPRAAEPEQEEPETGSAVPAATHRRAPTPAAASAAARRRWGSFALDER